MKRFSQFASCKKCGSALKDIEWKPSKLGPYALGGAPVLMPEELHVVCRCCGHKDVFTPLDAPGPLRIPQEDDGA